VCHLVALYTVMLRGPRTYSGRESGPGSGVRGRCWPGSGPRMARSLPVRTARQTPAGLPPPRAPPQAGKRNQALRTRTRRSPPRPPGTSWPSPRPPAPAGPSRPATWTRRWPP
jgi:hypothetical protein